MSEHSPGPIEDTETLVRIIIIPDHVQGSTGLPKASVLTHAQSIGMSVFRDGLASDDEILTAAKQLVHNARAAALRQGKNKDKNVGVFGVLRMSCGEIRSFRLAGEPDPSYCVYDTATRAAPAHADAFQRIANGPPEVVDARRNALFECLKAGFVSVDQFRGGLLKSLAPERVS